MASPSMSWVPRRGDVIAEKYRVEDLLGTGGMGAVLRATHLALLQPVAIKVLKPDDDPASATRFLREARAAAALSHPHVMRVLDVGEMDSAMPYLVMEFLEGENLSQRLQRGSLTQEEILEIFSQICDGLGEAHTKGIVHRDIKPANIFLVAPSKSSSSARSKGIHAKLLDFGIAKPIDPNVSVEVSITGTSQVLGTPRYMSPEQMSSSATVDARADVWGIGVSLYEALAGRPPFDGANAYEVGAQILTREPPPIRTLRPDVSPLLAIVIDRCLRKDASERYADANELLAALQGPAPPPSVATMRVVKETLPLTTPLPLPVPSPAVASTAIGVTSDVAKPPPPPPQRSSMLMIGAAIMFSLAALGLMAKVLQSKSSPPSSVATPPSAIAAAAPPAPTPAAEEEPEEPEATLPAPSPSSTSSSAPPVRRTTKPVRRSPPPRPAPRAAPVMTAAPDER